MVGKIQEMHLLVLFLLGISIVYFFGIAPDMTWMGLAGDFPNYVSSSVLFQKAFLAGYPFYIMVGWVFERLPFNPYWNLGLLSAVSTMMTSIFIYLTIRLFTGRGIYPFIGLVAYPAAFIVWTQSVIPEVYTFSRMLLAVGGNFVFRGIHENRTFLYVGAVILGLSLGAHPLVVFAIVPVLVYTYKKVQDLKLFISLVLIGSLGTLSYLQVVLDNSSNSLIESGFLQKVKFTFVSLNYVGGLSLVPLWPTTDRLVDAGKVFLLSVGVIVPFLFLFKKVWWDYKGEVSVLLVAGGGPWLVYLLGFPPQWITYTVPLVAFGIVVGGIAAKYFPYKEGAYVAVLAGVILLGFNLYQYDIGRSIDPSPTSMRRAYGELDTLEAGTVVYTLPWGHMRVLVDTYNKLNSDRLVTIDIALRCCGERGTYRGVEVPRIEPEGLRYWQEGTDVKEIQRLNPDRRVVVAYIRDPKEVAFSLIPASDYYSGLNNIQRRGESSLR